MRAQAITTCPHPSLQTQTRHSWRLRRMPWLGWACAAWRVRAGRQMPLSAKRLKRSRRRGPKGVLAVEMEAAALYAFAHVANARVLCLAHVTNTMGIGGEDLKRVKQTAHRMLSPFSRRRWPRCQVLIFHASLNRRHHSKPSRATASPAKSPPACQARSGRTACLPACAARRSSDQST